MALELGRTRTTKNGIIQQLQTEVAADGKRKGMGWVTIGKGVTPASELQTESSKAGPSTKAAVDAPGASQTGDDAIGWALGGVATAGIILGGIWLLAHRP